MNPTIPTSRWSAPTQWKVQPASVCRSSRRTRAVRPGIDAAFAELVRAQVDAVIAGTDPVLLDRREQIAALALRHALPAISFTRQLAQAGLLMSYGPDIGWMYRQAGGYIGQILKGAKPAAMPVMQSIRFELVVNLKTARQLGLAVPPAFLASVDEVID